MHLTTTAGQMGLPLVMPKDLELGNYYVIDVPVFDDISGDERLETDIVHYCQRQVTGQVKPVRTFRFCQRQAEMRLSQMIGVQFYGPLVIQLPKTRALPIVNEAPGLDDLFKEIK